MATSRGVQIIKSTDDSIIIFSTLFDDQNVKITGVSEKAQLRIWHLLPVSGDLAVESFDFNDFTFKSGAITTASTSMTQLIAENSTYNTGVWVYRLQNVSDFTVGDKYIFEINHSELVRPVSYYIQYGGVEGDQDAIDNEDRDISELVWLTR